MIVGSIMSIALILAFCVNAVYFFTAVILTVEAIVKRHAAVLLIIYWAFFIPAIIISAIDAWLAIFVYLGYSPFPIVFLIRYKRSLSADEKSKTTHL